MSSGNGDWVAEDAIDRRTALEVAASMVESGDGAYFPRHEHTGGVLHIADVYYAWLRERKSLLPRALTLNAGDVRPQPGFAPK